MANKWDKWHAHRNRQVAQWTWDEMQERSSVSPQQRMLREHMSWIAERGSTLEGYYDAFNATGDAAKSVVERLWIADQEYLGALIRCGLLDAAGHESAHQLAWLTLHRKMWVKQMCAGGITVGDTFETVP